MTNTAQEVEQIKQIRQLLTEASSKIANLKTAATSAALQKTAIKCESLVDEARYSLFAAE